MCRPTPDPHSPPLAALPRAGSATDRCIRPPARQIQRTTSKCARCSSEPLAPAPSHTSPPPRAPATAADPHNPASSAPARARSTQDRSAALPGSKAGGPPPPRAGRRTKPSAPDQHLPRPTAFEQPRSGRDAPTARASTKSAAAGQPCANSDANELQPHRHRPRRPRRLSPLPEKSIPPCPSPDPRPMKMAPPPLTPRGLCPATPFGSGEGRGGGRGDWRRWLGFPPEPLQEWHGSRVLSSFFDQTSSIFLLLLISSVLGLLFSKFVHTVFRLYIFSLSVSVLSAFFIVLHVFQSSVVCIFSYLSLFSVGP
ncbi:hypothetical protein ZWY2020_033518 [Hordeum vulgare]|nr:hypothetical protein ZWY2020_033518 [Hordeum vulgare]